MSSPPLVYICDEYPGAASVAGGIGIAFREEAEWFAGHGSDVTVVVATDDRRPGSYTQKGVRVVVPPLSRTVKLRALQNRERVAHQAKAALGSREGLVICADYSGPIWRKTFRQPLLVQLHGCATLNARQQGKKPSRTIAYFERRTLSLATAVQSCSDFVARRTVDVLRVSGKRCRTIRNAVDTAAFQPDRDRVIATDIVFVGKFNRIKGVLVLAEAIGGVFRAVPTARLIMIGGDTVEDGRSVREAFLQRVDPSHRNRILIAGRIPREEVAARVRAAGVLVLPSFTEAFPIAVLEAMASGRPVVASNRGGIPELVRDGETGLLADPEAPDTFVQTLIRMLNDPDRANAMGDAGRRIVLAEHTPEAVFRQTAAFHREILGEAA